MSRQSSGVIPPVGYLIHNQTRLWHGGRVAMLARGPTKYVLNEEWRKSFKFSVLQADPDRRRGERVNVGLSSFWKTGLTSGCRSSVSSPCLPGINGTMVAEAYATQLTKGFDRNRSAQELLSGISFVSQIFEASEVGNTTVHSDAEYEDKVNSILQHLVKKPSLTKADKQQKINSEISKMLKRAEVLATKGQDYR